MRGRLRRVAIVLPCAIVALLLAPILLPRLLDRVYYRGPPSDHFDGHRFFNPEGEASARRRGTAAFAWRALTGRREKNWPDTVPVAQSDPAAMPDPAAMIVTWIGHSTVLVQTAGLAILTDPVWSGRVGPWGLIGPARVRAPGIRFDDLPRIDLVLVSHNHYDHMDLATLKRLWARDRPLIVTSLGNDTILKGAGITARAADWGGRVPVRAARPGVPAIEAIVERVHHWGSRRGSDRNRALWSGFTVTLPGGNLFFAGDTGWGDGGWAAAAARHGPFRLALLPIGAYQPAELMRPSHIGPAEAAAAFRTLGAAHALAIHWGTFRLSDEAIDDPPALLRATLAKDGVAADRFRAAEVGQPWQVPAIP